MLAELPEGASIRKLVTRELPNVNYAFFVGPTEAQDTLKDLSAFYCMPYIDDKFENHDRRHKWEGDMESKYSWFNEWHQQHSGLSLNPLNFLTTLLYYLKGQFKDGDVEGFKQKIDAIDKYCITSKVEYGPKPLNEKIKYQTEVREKIYELFEFLAVKT
ncbi:hypothetical protein J4401_04420 [Candidatus Woesearchaeota archaeon]|nr:hypothetical protein [Candidatus Woesearchaeota archaeon]